MRVPFVDEARSLILLVGCFADEVTSEILAQLKAGRKGWSDLDEWLKRAWNSDDGPEPDPNLTDWQKVNHALTFINLRIEECARRHDYTSAAGWACLAYNMMDEYTKSLPTSAAGDGDVGGGTAPPPDPADDEGEEGLDALYAAAVNFVLETETARISTLQGRFNLNYGAAKGLLDDMAEQGIVSVESGDGGKRQVLITAEEWERRQEGDHPETRDEGSAQQSEDREREDTAASPKGHAGDGEEGEAPASPSDAGEEMDPDAVCARVEELVRQMKGVFARAGGLKYLAVEWDAQWWRWVQATLSFALDESLATLADDFAAETRLTDLPIPALEYLLEQLGKDLVRFSERGKPSAETAEGGAS